MREDAGGPHEDHLHREIYLSQEMCDEKETSGAHNPSPCLGKKLTGGSLLLARSAPSRSAGLRGSFLVSLLVADSDSRPAISAGSAIETHFHTGKTEKERERERPCTLCCLYGGNSTVIKIGELRSDWSKCK